MHKLAVLLFLALPLTAQEYKIEVVSMLHAHVWLLIEEAVISCLTAWKGRPVATVVSCADRLGILNTTSTAG